MKNKLCPFLLSIALLVGCASVAQPSELYFPVIVDIGEGLRFPDPITPGRFASPANAPESLGAAVSALANIVPTTESGDQAKTRACAMASVWDLSAAYSTCAIAYCELLPVGSRVQSCGYVVRLQGWVQETWLGGDCDRNEFHTPSRLVGWFRSNRVTDCAAMSEVLMVAHMRDALGVSWNEEELLRADRVSTDDSPAK